ncbi:hypothetical protein BC830DRAFT_1169546 [Chytriomyces sp. MP71]|nr:hypothetical protein BC830DRAFT_1169546 [Chytriomyces sp. MP71]
MFVLIAIAALWSAVPTQAGWCPGDVQTNPSIGQMVYIRDSMNFCLMLPSPSDPTLKQDFYSQGKYPSIAAAEGLGLQSFCLGDYYMPNGSLPMPKGVILSAHAKMDFSDPNDAYYQVTGRMDCNAAGIDCTIDGGGGQYDNNKCGSAPDSGVATNATAGNLVSYVLIAGDGTFCMRVCSGNLEEGNKCNGKQDTGGCEIIMPDFDTGPGFTYRDVLAGTFVNQTLATSTATATLIAKASAAADVATSSKSNALLSAPCVFVALIALASLAI